MVQRGVITAPRAGAELTADGLRAVFDAPAPLTIGLEEEVILVDAATFAPADVAATVVGEDFKLELPAAQLEIVSTPCTTVGEATAELRAGRRALAARLEPGVKAIAAGVHPHAPPLGVLNRGERYDAIVERYGDVARAQLVCALQVHVAVGSADATLAVHNALRGHLPELAAVAANAPFYAGRDSGFASVRPLIGTLLPRQGVPPAIPSWAAFADMLRWAGDPKTWWFEVRPHVAYGTIELRVPDAQATLREGGAVAAFAQSLVAWLAERHEAGEPLGAAASWRIEENRFAAARHGLDAEFIDLESGAKRSARDLLADRVEQLAPVAERLGCAGELAALDVVRNGADRQREAGLADAPRWLTTRFLQ